MLFEVLVPSAAGGVGCAAMQIGTNLGCRMYGNVRSEEKAAFLRERYPDAQVPPSLQPTPFGQHGRRLSALGIYLREIEIEGD